MKNLHPYCTNCTSKQCFINRYVKAEEKKIITARKTFQFYKAGTEIFHEGAPVFGIYFIHTGKVKVFNTGPAGRTQIVRLAQSGDILGHRGFGENMFYPISATALEDSVICFIQNLDFLHALEKNPSLSIHLMMFYAAELRRAEYKLRSLSQMSVKQKIADALLTVKDIYGTTTSGRTQYLNAHLSRQEYAEIIGASNEEVIRTFSQLKKEGIVELQLRKIGIKKESALKELTRGFRNILLP